MRKHTPEEPLNSLRIIIKRGLQQRQQTHDYTSQTSEQNKNRNIAAFLADSRKWFKNVGPLREQEFPLVLLSKTIPLKIAWHLELKLAGFLGAVEGRIPFRTMLKTWDTIVCWYLQVNRIRNQGLFLWISACRNHLQHVFFLQKHHSPASVLHEPQAKPR